MKKMINKFKKVKKGFGKSVKQTIIVGGNEVSIQLAEHLTQLGQNIVIIEQDSKRIKQIQERVDGLVLEGKGTDLSVLREAGVEDTDLLIAITTDDQYNLLAGIYGRNLGVEQVIVQIKDQRLFDSKLQIESLKLNLVLNPFTMTINRIKGLVKPGVGSQLSKLLGGKVKVSKLKISHQGDFAYQTVKELDLPEDSLLLAVLRQGRALIPHGNDKLYPGDTLFIIFKQSFKGKLGELINYSTKTKNKMVLVGGGRINYQLAKACAQDFVVTLIEESKTKCEQIVDELNDVLVLEGKGTDLRLLKEEGVANADAFIAGTNNDEANLLLANIANKLGVKYAISVVSDINYNSLSDLIAVDHIISPSLLAIDTILDYLHQGQVSENTILAGQVKFAQVKNKKRNKLAQLNLPTDLLIGLVYRNKQVIIPDGNTRLERGDELLIFSLLTKRDIKSYFN
ncbi:K+ transport system, NAD-binding component [Halobacteroides halobius DSM 5150]|uniref:Trk system potassium uptake protein TrkA n=1 Tax=Halobacteroides halobius (strain ATCC 35273 / DSM 5150 / MD-1) TaxID=748449 RepID=L0K861_HALHC|nr:Trk system potassium transporter TrkA [Halobacteroides halobius]AGB41467.1 K+ transport system, NAD-binding component [Halobacteroides halobius DSM 5150]